MYNQVLTLKSLEAGTAGGMVKNMRSINLALMILLSLSPLLSSHQSGLTTIYEDLGAMFGVLLIASFYYVPWRALGDNSSVRRIAAARVYAGLVMLLVLAGLYFVAGRNGARESATLALVIAPTFFVLTGILNFFAFNKKLIELRNHNKMPDEAQGQDKNAQERQTANYILAHWRGELPLAQSYWINAVLLGNLVLSYVLLNLARILEKAHFSLRQLATFMLAAIIVGSLAWLWGVVGVWRSVSRYRSGNGAGWIVALVVLTLCGNVIFMAHNFVRAQWPQMREFYALAMGKDKMPPIEIKSTPQSESIYLSAYFGEGSADRFAEALRRSPQVRTIVLNSSGGRLLEAEHVASMIREKQLDTYVEGLCASACTYVFLAGKDRAATPNARIGFHQPSFPGVQGFELELSTKSMLDKYRQAKLPEAFIQKIGSTKSEDMWYPSREEMLAAGVITRTSLGDDTGSHSFSIADSKEGIVQSLLRQSLWRVYEQHLPDRFKEVVDMIWNLKTQGKSDADIHAQIQAMTGKDYIAALKVTDNTNLDEYALLVYDELREARQISTTACHKMLNGKLNAGLTLSRKLLDRDSKLMEKVLISTPRSDVYTMQSREFADSARRLSSSLSRIHQQVTADMNAYADQPDLQCDAFIALYSAILKLEDRDRHIIMSGLVQAK